MKQVRLVMLLLGLLALLMPSNGLLAAAEGAALAQLHQANKVGCADCHGTAKKIVVDDSEKGVNQRCIGCHGNLDVLAVKDKGHIKPHQSHLGEINCTACHRGHEPSVAYCNGCHTFNLPMPGGTAAKKEQPVRKAGKPRIETTDVVVIGAGAAGMTAAITAHDAGVKVIVLEKQPITGGNSMLAAGGMNAAETKFQMAKGIKDSVDLMYQDTMKGGKNTNDPDLAMILAKNSASSVDWLTSIGADISDVGRMAGASVYRTHRPTGGAAVGAHIANTLKQNAVDRKMDVRVNSKVVKIIEDAQGRVTGVQVEGKHSGRYIIKAKAVVLAAGGFSANPEKVAYYQPAFKGMTTSNQPGATGDGMDLGDQAGGS